MSYNEMIGIIRNGRRRRIRMIRIYEKNKKRNKKENKNTVINK